ncbi:polyprenyl synthetase family protein, partial [Rhizobium ruizarguesonis]
MHLPSFSFQFRSARQFTPCRVHRPFLLSGAKNEQESGSLGVVIPLEESKNKLASIKPLVDLTRADMERVNQLILSKAGSDVQMIPEVANHLISSGGKRLRPMLT